MKIFLNFYCIALICDMTAFMNVKIFSRNFIIWKILCLKSNFQISLLPTLPDLMLMLMITIIIDFYKIIFQQYMTLIKFTESQLLGKKEIFLSRVQTLVSTPSRKKMS